MARPTRTDRLLLITLLPIFAVCMALHMKEAFGNGLAQPPVWALYKGEAEYPEVGGLRLERGASWQEFEVGDRLIRVGDVELRGCGHYCWEAIAVEQANQDLVAELTVERDGTRFERTVSMQTHETPWYRFPFILSFVFVATVVLLRSPGKREAQLFFAAMLSFVIFETPFIGGPRLQTYASGYLFLLGGGPAIYLVFRFLIAFPEEVPADQRPSKHWALIGAAFPLVRLPYLMPTPLPSDWTPAVVLATDVLFFSLGLGVMTWNFRHADPIGRRRLKWVLYGAYVGVAPVLLALLLRVGGFGLADDVLQRLFELAVIPTLLVPGGVLVSILRYNLFDIDRVWTATAAASVVLLLGVFGTLSLLPALAAPLSLGLGVTPRSAELVLLVLAIAIGVPAAQRARPRVEAWLFPERPLRQRAFADLSRDLGACRTPTEVLTLLEHRLEDLLSPGLCIAFAPASDGFAAVTEWSRRRAPVLATDAAWLSRLEQDPTPWRVPARGGRAADAALAPLWDLSVELVIPVRCGKDLGGLILLDAKRSGDIYTPEEEQLLGAVAQKASTELRRMRDAEAIAQERERSQQLQTAKEAAERAHLAKTRFLEAARDELRQPLLELEREVGALSVHVEDTPAQSTVEKIQSSTHAVGDMFNALLDMSVLDAGGLEAHEQDFELGPLLSRLASMFEVEAREKGIELHFEPVAARIHSDPVLLGRIVQNLLANAIRYTERGEVSLRVGPPSAASGSGASPALAIEVRDTGPGISADQREEIFREFVQLEGSEQSGGLGLGLSIVDRAARLLDHPVELESEPGAGSRFRVVVPLATAAI